MAKPSKYAIHTDFLHFPVITFSFNLLIISLINLLLRLERLVRQHRIIRAATNHRVASNDGNTIKILQINPSPRDTPSPAVIYFHGGAYAMTYASSHVYSADWYARDAGCTVFLVDYRLSHLHPFPAGFNDCCAALSWVSEHAAELGVDPERIALMGDSAGGGLAASVSQWACDQRRKNTSSSDLSVCAQLLIYPTLDRTCSTPSALNFHDVPLWNAISNRAMWSAYLRNTKGKGVPAYAAAADRDDLSQLPAAYVETAEFDPLHDEGIAYAARLKQAGVATQLFETSNTIHAFDTVFSSAITQQSLTQRGKFLRTAFYPEQAAAVARHPLAGEAPSASSFQTAN